MSSSSSRSRLRANAFGISIDGYGAGPAQALDNPMGVGGMALHQWVFGTKTFQKMAGDFAGSLIGNQVGREGVDDECQCPDRLTGETTDMEPDASDALRAE